MLLVTCNLFFTACISDDDFTTSANDRLTFSTDTVAFDTIISGQPTNTYTFTVYNRASKAIRIPTVALAGGAASPFRVNVDGASLTDGSATDFEIGAKDSMIVYLMVNLPDADSDEPVPASDRLTFTTEAGVSQSVELRAAGQSVIELKALTITSDTTLSARRPYRITDSLVVAAGHTLTLAAGTRLYFHPDASLIVHGTLRSEGTLDAPVMLRGDRLGNMFAGQPYDRIPGQWGGVQFTGESYGNALNYTDIHSGSYGIRVDSSDVSRRTLTLENSVVHNVTHNALDVRAANVYVGNSQISNAGGNCLNILGGDVEIVHCTIARFYVFTGGSGYALNFANYDGTSRLPLNRLRIANSIVTGYQTDEVMGNTNAEHEDDAFNYSFEYSLLNTPRPDTDDEGHFTNCRWDNDDDDAYTSESLLREDNFTPKFDLSALTFSFSLAEQSHAVGTASPSLSASTYPLDRYGRSRGTAPDMGCYQHVPSNNQ